MDPLNLLSPIRVGLITERFTQKNWEQLNCETSYKQGKAIKKPEQFDLLLELAGKLSHGFPFVRVDFLIQNERIYFGEMTFTPS